MKRLIIEDSQIPNTQRQVAGMETTVAKPEAVTFNSLLQPDPSRNNPKGMEAASFPVEALNNAIGDTFINITNLQKLLDQAKENPTLQKHVKKINSAEEKLKTMAEALRDIWGSVSILKMHV